MNDQLWPRLSRVPARLLYDERREHEITSLAVLSSPDHPRRTYVATGGTRVTDRQVLALVTELRQVASELGYPEPQREDRVRIAFDRAAAEVVYRHMRMNTVEAANNEVWNFLALVAAPDLVRWRWFDSSNVERWLSSDRTRHMFARLWWQALTFADSGPDTPADFTLLRTLAERDLNALTERRAIGGVPRLARAVAVTARAEDSGDENGSVLIRRITPLLRRRLVFIDFASLTDDQIADQLRAIKTQVSRPVANEAPSLAEQSDSRPQEVRRPTAVATTRRTVVERIGDQPELALFSLGGSTPDEGRGAPRGDRLTFVDLCCGAGGLAQGLEASGFEPLLLLDERPVACETVRANRPTWNIEQVDLFAFAVTDHPLLRGVDLLSAGLPRVQASATANRVRGSDREIELLDATIEILGSLRARALLLDNVPALAIGAEYRYVRERLEHRLRELGYEHRWFVVDAAEHGVPQVRRHGVLVALEQGGMHLFHEPPPSSQRPPTGGEALRDSMGARGWPQAQEWSLTAGDLAPTLVGGSWDRGGADLGPTGSKRAWRRLGVDGGTVADEPPGPDFVWNPAALDRDGLVKLTVEQVARLQGFPDDWVIAGRKTARYRQLAEAMPPSLAAALGRSLTATLVGA